MKNKIRLFLMLSVAILVQACGSNDSSGAGGSGASGGGATTATCPNIPDLIADTLTQHGCPGSTSSEFYLTARNFALPQGSAFAVTNQYCGQTVGVNVPTTAAEFASLGVASLILQWIQLSLW